MPATSSPALHEHIHNTMVNLLIAFLRLCARLPLSWVRALGFGLGGLLWHLARSRRHIVRVNLEKTMPELSTAELEALAYRHFIAFGQSVMDRAWLWHAPESLVRQRLRWVGDVSALTAPGPLVMFAPHFVGLDAGGMAVSLDVPGPVAFIFVGQSHPAIEQWVRQGRERSGNVRPYFRHQGMRQILSGIKKGEPLHLSPDMDFGPEESIFVPFMGVDNAATLPSLSRLSKVAGARVVPVVTRMTALGYDVEVHAPLVDFPSADAQQDTARMNSMLADWVRTMPEQYYWVHRRFKTRTEGEPGFY
jgi:KDO2-lipid IV(A) lauroyltransferase